MAGNGITSEMQKSQTYTLLYLSVFLEERLKELNIVFSNLRYEKSKGWESWSEKEERQNAVVFNNWLKAELGSEKSFDWGEVWADYDEKGGSSSIGIKYKN